MKIDQVAKRLPQRTKSFAAIYAALDVKRPTVGVLASSEGI